MAIKNYTSCYISTLKIPQSHNSCHGSAASIRLIRVISTHFIRIFSLCLCWLLSLLMSLLQSLVPTSHQLYSLPLSRWWWIPSYYSFFWRTRWDTLQRRLYMRILNENFHFNCSKTKKRGKIVTNQSKKIIMTLLFINEKKKKYGWVEEIKNQV